MSEFYIGQRVISTNGFDYGPGTIVAMDDCLIGVQFDKPRIIFHDLGGRCENNHGYWVFESIIAPLEDVQDSVPEYALESAEVLYV